MRGSQSKGAESHGGTASKGGDDHPGTPSWEWERRGAWAILLVHERSPLCAQELAGFRGVNKNATGLGGIVSINSRGERRLSPFGFRPLGSARGRNSANASC